MNIDQIENMSREEHQYWEDKAEAKGLICSPTEEQVLKAIYESGLHQYAPQVLCKDWKDNIDIKNKPSSYIMGFVRKLYSQNQ